MKVDSAGLGHSVDRGRIRVHYPKRKDGVVTYGAAYEIGDVPSWYATNPPNAITAERMAIWRELGARV